MAIQMGNGVTMRELYKGIRRGTLVEIVSANASRVTFCCATVPTSVKLSMPRKQFLSAFRVTTVGIVPRRMVD